MPASGRMRGWTPTPPRSASRRISKREETTMPEPKLTQETTDNPEYWKAAYEQERERRTTAERALVVPFNNAECQVDVETELAFRVTELVRASVVAIDRMKAAQAKEWNEAVGVMAMHDQR